MRKNYLEGSRNLQKYFRHSTKERLFNHFLQLFVARLFFFSLSNLTIPPKKKLGTFSNSDKHFDILNIIENNFYKNIFCQ
jgi:hypothetical protein